MKEEGTIELIDLLTIFWKWRWFIIILTFICSLAAGLISFNMPKIYNVTAMVEPGAIGTKESGELIYIDTPLNIKSRIEGGGYSSKIINALKLDPGKGMPKFRVSIPEESKIIKITSEYESAKRDLGIKVMNQLLRELFNQYQEIIVLKKENLEKQIMLNKSDMEGIDNKIRLLRKNIKINEEEKKFLVEELKKVRANTEIILGKRDALLSEKSQNYAITILLYSNTIQQNMIYINELNSQLLSIRRKQEDFENNIENLEIGKEKFQKEIETLELEKDFVTNIKHIQEPQVSMYPVKPNKKRYVVLAGAIGFFISIFLVFFLDLVQKMRVNLKSSNTPNRTLPVKNQEL